SPSSLSSDSSPMSFNFICLFQINYVDPGLCFPALLSLPATLPNSALIDEGCRFLAFLHCSLFPPFDVVLMHPFPTASPESTRSTASVPTLSPPPAAPKLRRSSH